MVYFICWLNFCLLGVGFCFLKSLANWGIYFFMNFEGFKAQFIDMSGFFRHFLKIAVICAAGIFISACSVGSLPSLGGGLFGSEKKKETKAKAVALSEDTLLAAAKNDVSPDGALAPATTRCTKFKIWESGRFLTVYNVGQYGDGLAVRYRGELTKAARECAFQPGTVHLKYGFAGRVLLGPKGQAGTFNMPLLVYLTDAKGKPIKTEKVTVPVTVDPGQTMGYFSVVRRMDIPLQGTQSGKSYRVFVGFEKIDQS